MKIIKITGVVVFLLKLLQASSCSDSLVEKEVAEFQNQKEIGKSFGLEILESQVLISDNSSTHFYKISGFNKDSLNHWLFLQNFSRNMLPDAIHTDYRFYNIDILENDIDLIKKKYFENYIARGIISNSKKGKHLSFEVTPMGSNKFQCPENFEPKVSVVFERK